MQLKCKDRLLDLREPVVMGVLNITPDSFYDGGRYEEMKSIMSHVEKMVQEGAKVIDIGGMSTRPGAKIISSTEEIDRILPATIEIRKSFPDIFISIDTVYAETAHKTLEAGADLINDISAFQIDEELINVVAKYKAGYILMHMQNNPIDMQDRPQYEDVVREIMHFFISRTQSLHKRGVHEIIIDPGFGFGKTIDHNYEILQKLSVFRILKYPLLSGVSRKSMLYKYLDINPEEALPATSIANYISLCQGASLLRVHDVKEAIQAIKLFKKCNIKE